MRVGLYSTRKSFSRYAAAAAVHHCIATQCVSTRLRAISMLLLLLLLQMHILVFGIHKRLLSHLKENTRTRVSEAKRAANPHMYASWLSTSTFSFTNLSEL